MGRSRTTLAGAKTARPTPVPSIDRLLRLVDSRRDRARSRDRLLRPSPIDLLSVFYFLPVIIFLIWVRQRNRTAPPCNVLGVFQLSLDADEADLRGAFERYAPVQSLSIPLDRQTRQSRGFAFVTMNSVEDATLCIEKLAGAVIKGSAIRVDYSFTQRPHDPTPGRYMGTRDRPRGLSLPFLHLF